MDSVNLIQSLITILGTALPLVSTGAVAVSRLVTRIALMEAEVRRLANAVEKQNGRISKLEASQFRHHPQG